VAKLSVVIPSRDEQFLVPTIDDIFAHAKGDTEVVAVLDSDRWPAEWKEVTDRHPRLHTLHNGQSLGMRTAINRGVASAASRGADYVMKLDGHCSLSEGFDITLLEEIEDNWVVVPRRGRLDPETWTATDTHKPDIDYHYLSFPDDPNDFGGAGLNGKVWDERAVQRKDIELDEEMSSQGSCWLTSVANFQRLELMDEASYGKFWNEMQEIGLKCWLSGGKLMVNKRAKYLHLHKGKKYGRGYKLPESALTTGRNHTMLWLWNEAWGKQTLPFSWLIEHFWPVPTWPENWEERLYAERKPRAVISYLDPVDQVVKWYEPEGLQVISASYGVDDDNKLDVTARIRALVRDNSLDIIVNNSTLTPGKNPFRGKKKVLSVQYVYEGGRKELVQRDEKDWLIIGQGQRSSTIDCVDQSGQLPTVTIPLDQPLLVCDICGGRTESLMEEPNSRKKVCSEQCADIAEGRTCFVDPLKVIVPDPPRTATALNDYLIRKFSISDRRLRGPMPIELRDFHRNDLAQLFAELGFTKGAEIGVAEGHYSGVLCKSIPNLEELLLVDPWRRYDDNPWAHSQEHQDFSLNETKRKTAGYNVRIMQDYSMNAVQEAAEESLDFVYIDGHHGFDFVMQDLIEWSKRVRSGGIISGDDYYHFKKNWAGVVQAVNAYTDAHRISPWFLIDAPRSVDFFFVKP
jgi:GT2 family glycosyltransferase